MDKIALPTISIIIGILGLFLGIILGSFLGRVGAFEILGCILRIPIILIRSPQDLKSKWKMWQELRGLRKIERLKRQREIKGLEKQISDHKKEIRKIKVQIHQVKWEFAEPKEV